jgi:hypothetical protein
MPGSTSTLLDTANVVFRAIGERPVLTINNVQGDRVKDCINQACLDTESLHTWDWLYRKSVANSWVTNFAALSTYQRIFGVTMGDLTKGFTELVYVPELQLDRSPIKPYKGTSDLADYYTLVAGGARFSNYPDDTTSQGRIIFHIQEPIKVPTQEIGKFDNVPERYMPLIQKKACHLMCIRYLDDAQAASYFQQEFEQLVQQFRAFERKAPVGKLSMYRRGR